MMSKFAGQVTHPDVAKILREMADDPEVFNTREHIKLLEALSIAALNRGELMAAMKGIQEATKAITRLHEIEEGRRLVVHVQDVNLILERVIAVISRHVQDSYTRNLIAQELMGIPIGPANQTDSRLLKALPEHLHAP